MADAFSPGLLDAIKGFEGYSSTPYPDYGSYASGWGTPSKPGDFADKETHEQRLRDSVTKAAQVVDSQAPGLPAGVRDAMISLTFNTGDKWARSGLGEKLRAGDYEGAKDLFTQYNKAGGRPLQGLINRRNTEASWFDSTNIPDNAVAKQQDPNMPPRTDPSLLYDPSRMADRQDMGAMAAQQQAPGLLASLAGPQQQGGGGIGGLLGSINPEKMAYLAMIAKGLNPYTDVDPTKMLALAQSSRENAIKLAQQQREHELNRAIQQGHLNLSTSAEKRAQDKYIQERADEAEQLKEYRRINTPSVPDAGATGAEGSFGATEASQVPGVMDAYAQALPDDSQGAPGAIGARGAVDAASQFTPTSQPAPAPPAVAQAPAPVPESAATRMQKIQDYVNRFPNSKFTPMLEREKEKLVAQEEARQKPLREKAAREQMARELNIQPGTKAYKHLMIEGKDLKSELSPSEFAAVGKLENELVGLRANRDQVQEALDLTPNTMSGFGAHARSYIGSRLGEWIPGVDVEKSPAYATSRLNQILSSQAIKDMSATLKGSTTDKEMNRYLGIAADLSEPINNRIKSLNSAMKLYDNYINVKQTAMDQIRAGDYASPTGGQSGRAKPDPLGLR